MKEISVTIRAGFTRYGGGGFALFERGNCSNFCRISKFLFEKVCL